MTEDNTVGGSKVVGDPGAANATAGKNSIAAFVEWIKPYKELAAIGGGIVVVLSGGVSWAVSHFATVEQLSHVECRLSVNINTQSLPILSSMISMKIEGKWAQIAAWSKDTSPDILVKVDQLKSDIKELIDERKRADSAYQSEVAAAPIKCASKK